MSVKTELVTYNGQVGTLTEHASGDGANEFMDTNTFALPKRLQSKLNGQLADLQAFDFLIGNVDRHLENYIIDKGKNVKAIDNDMSFSTVDVSKLKDIPDSKFEGLPLGYTQQTKQRINALTTEKLRQILTDAGLGDEAIEQAVKRLKVLKEDIARKGNTPPVPSPKSNYVDTKLLG